MAKSPAFRFYVGDFLVGTMHLTTEQIGAYVLLLLHQWDQGHIPDDQDACARIARCQASTVASIWHKFGICHDGKRKNPRMESERDLQTQFREKQATNGAKRWKNSGGNAKPEPSLNGGNAKPEPSLSGGNASAEPSLNGGNASRGQCLSFSSSLSDQPLSSPHGDSTDTVTSLTEPAEKKEGAAPAVKPATLATLAAVRIRDLFGATRDIGTIAFGTLIEHANHGVIPADEKKWAALSAMKKARADAGSEPPKDLRYDWLINMEKLAEKLPIAFDIALARFGSADASTDSRGSMTTPPAGDWHARACKKWPGVEIPSVWTDLPPHFRQDLIA